MRKNAGKVRTLSEKRYTHRFLFMRLINWIFVSIFVLVLAGCRSEEAVMATLPAATAVPTLPIGVSLVTRAVPTTAVIQTTATPLPTATVTPTATPIVYTIVEGDTLLGIAIQNDTTTEEIQALNPEARPELLQIGQTLILPPPVVRQFEGAASTAVPIQIEIDHITAFQTPVGSLWLMGELTNLGALPVGDVQVSIGLLDAAGVTVGTAVAWAATPIILPGQSAPFGVLLNETPIGFVQPVISVAGGASLTDLGTQYVDLLVGETAVTHEDDRVQVVGLVQNTGQGTAQAIVITAAIYDEHGRVIGYQQKQLADPLLPAESIAFELTAVPPGGQTDHVTLLAHAQAVRE